MTESGRGRAARLSSQGQRAHVSFTDGQQESILANSRTPNREAGRGPPGPAPALEQCRQTPLGSRPARRDRGNTFAQDGKRCNLAIRRDACGRPETGNRWGKLSRTVRRLKQMLSVSKPFRQGSRAMLQPTRTGSTPAKRLADYCLCRHRCSTSTTPT